MALGNDRAARNEASYRPSGIGRAGAVDAAKALNFVRDLWAALEPSGPATFDSVDRAILRLSLERLFLGRTGKRAREFQSEFAVFIKPIVAHQGFSDEIAGFWTSFLLRTLSVEDPDVFKFSQIASTSTRDSDFAIASRAFLLLRVASGAVAQVFERAGVMKDALGFWRSQIGDSRGLWGADGEPQDLTELWSPIELLLSDIEAFSQAEVPTFHRIASGFGSALSTLGSCERVALWTVAAL